ncbi:MAG: hypothetical protein JW941_11820 [Candidatus Coatesbacteria bacterium]|nr:hypothetical protein [Candidatus Coatesbacteria bacterium]
MPRYGLFRTIDGDEFYRKIFELEKAFCIQERADRLEFFEGTPSDLLSRGRVFNAEVELRWDSGHFAMLWESEKKDDIPDDASVFHCDDKSFPYLLWQDSGSNMNYPRGATQIIAQRYTKDGITRFVRFVGIK